MCIRDRVKGDSAPANGQEAAMSRVGKALYYKLFHSYTLKQWNVSASELDASVLERIPVRDDWDDRYFPNDKYQAQPKHGFTQLMQSMLTHPNIRSVSSLSLDQLYPKQNRHKMYSDFEHIYFTGPIDQYFGSSNLGNLEYRSINFEQTSVPTGAGSTERLVGQPGMVVNYPGPEVGFTRIVEYRHMYQQLVPEANTTMVKEFSTDTGEPYYPVPNAANRDLYQRYQALAASEESRHQVHFVGRLANYKYFNMDAAIRNAMDHFVRIHPKFQHNDLVFQHNRDIQAASAIFEPARTEHPSLDLVLSACARVTSHMPTSTWTGLMRTLASPFCNHEDHAHRVFVYLCDDAHATVLRDTVESGEDKDLKGCEWHFYQMNAPCLLYTSPSPRDS
eukprot:TRINITY_DN37686_c0_g1_i1.p1 TRINITY_DN37686_c0_g1~~TRINITY_DN37686_c0_g1_i1.p1  ORF type:complete len:391 (+),score=83.83 TRINITY_DN37686_c0_g1_i1:191-1363(+)